MDDKTYKTLTRLTAALLVASIGWIIYSGYTSSEDSGLELAILAGDRAFADGKYQRALEDYDKVLAEDRDQLDALRGKARTLLQLNRFEEALDYFDQAIALDPEFSGTYANRGIAHDRMGRHEQALRDYELAIALNPSVGEGPGWITKLLHMDAKGPPTVADRAEYLRHQLSLPQEQRLLSDPEMDEGQRTYSKRLR